MRILIMLALILGAAGGGFYAGIEYHKNAVVQDPELFLKELKEEMKKDASNKFGRIKDILLEDL
ncbi:MAG: hypothetical protein KC620_20395 [Myxococcales bacterium]|nr:hypothetical protein [Myxococcales bacterium]